MSESVSGAGDTDALAAEYVLGTLDPDERAAARKLLAEDAAFTTKVKVWERRLGELHLMVEPVEPEPGIWHRIKAKLPEPPAPEPVIALSEPAPEPEPQPQPAPEPGPAPEVELKSEAPPLAQPKPASEPRTEFWPELERAVLEAQSAPATPDQSPQGPGDAAALPLSPLAIVETEVAVPSEPVEEPPGPPPIVPLRPSADAGTPLEPPADAAVPLEPSADAAVPLKPPVEEAVARPSGAAEQPDRPDRVVQADEARLRLMRRRLTLWRAVATLMALAALVIPGLVALWKYAPERVPPALQPLQLLRHLGVRMDSSSGARLPAPPQAQFDE